jgi:hypothetical protein
VVLRPEEAGELAVTKWAEQLKAVAEVMNEKRKRRIKNAEAFQKLIAEESHPAWVPFINPGFHSKRGSNSDEIKGSHLANLRRAFRLYNRKLNDAFATVDGVPAKRFKDAVDNAKGDFSKGFAERTLPFTGDRMEGVGPAAIAGLWLVGDRRTDSYLRGGDDVFEGGPYKIVLQDSESAFKAALTGRIIQAGADIIKMERAAATMARQNGLINHLVQSFVDPALGLMPFAMGAPSHVDFIIADDELYLDIQVSQI